MPVLTAPAAPAQQAPRDQQPAIVVPFVRAAQEHIEPFMDVSTQMTANAQALSPVDVPAYGFARGIFILVECTGGTGAGTLKADAPFTMLSDIQLADVNSAPIVGPISGHDLYLINKWGGYRRATINPKNAPDFTNPTTGNASFLLYLPIEVSGRDGLGSLANLNAASSYKLRTTVTAAVDSFSANPTTLPVVRVRAWLDAWTQPSAADLRGNGQAVEPPAHGTTSFWSKQVFNVTAGQQTIRMQRVGNLLRNVIFIYRDATQVRNRTNFPPSFQIMWDTRLLKDYNPTIWRQQMSQRYNLPGADDAATGLDTGVYVEDYMHEFDGFAGAEMRDGWLPTVPSTRLEVQAVFGAAGTLTILTNDVSPAGEVYV
jgi:hypothetical protein